MPRVPQALDLENFLPYRLSILAQVVSEALHALYADRFGLTVTQWRVMAALGCTPGSCRSRSITRNAWSPPWMPASAAGSTR